MNLLNTSRPSYCIAKSFNAECGGKPVYWSHFITWLDSEKIVHMKSQMLTNDYIVNGGMVSFYSSPQNNFSDCLIGISPGLIFTI